MKTRSSLLAPALLRALLGRRAVLGLAVVLTIAGAAPLPARAADTVCVRLKLEIPQRLTFERDAFEATLKLTNRLDDVPLEDLDVDVVIRPLGAAADVAPPEPIFVAPPGLSGITGGIDGAGAIAPAGQGTVQFLLIPTAGAGGTLEAGVQYGVKAVIRARAGGARFDAETFEETITVKPQPELALHHFLPRRVKANRPFEVGVRVENQGFGTARNLQIESAQPRIVENLSGLLIGFSIIGTFRDAEILRNSLSIAFGNLAPGRCGMGAWAMVSTLDGDFIELDVSMSHAEELGGALTSLVRSVDSDFLIRRALDDRAFKDVVFDAALDLVESDDGVPDVLLESDCSSEPIVPHVAATSGNPSPDDPVGGLATDVELGWNYAAGPDPAAGTLPLLRVTRDRDGKVLAPQNAWLDEDDDGQPIAAILDFSTAGGVRETYTLSYDLSAFDDQPPLTTLVARDPFATLDDGVLVVTPVSVLVLAATDDASGVARTELSIDDGPLEPNRAFVFSSGTHTVRFGSVDARGNAETPRTVTVVVDASPPTFTLLAPDASEHPENRPLAFSFRIDDDTDPAPVAEVTLVRAGGAVVASLRDGQVLAPGVLTPGEHFLVVSAVDHVGNRTDAVAGPIVISARVVQAPRVRVLGVGDGDFVRDPVALVTEIESDDPIDTASITLDGAPLFPGTVVVEEGAHEVLGSAVDVAGRSASASLAFTIDTTAPAVVVRGLREGQLSATPVAPEVAVDDVNLATSNVLLDGATYASGDTIAEDGAHQLDIDALDRAGNRTRLALAFVVDTLPPRVTFSGFVEGALHGAPVTPGFVIDDTTTTTTTALLDGKAFDPAVPVGDGDHVLEVTTTDAVGQTTVARGRFRVDLTPPRVFVRGVSAGGVFAPGVAATVEVQEARPTSLDVSLDGAVYVEGTPITEAGPHVIVAAATDEAGHLTRVEVNFTVDVDVPGLFVDGVEDGGVYTEAVRPVARSDDPEARIEMLLDGLPYVDGAITAEGPHTLEASATNTRGGTARLTVRFLIDATPPGFVVVGVVDGGIYRDPPTVSLLVDSLDVDSSSLTLDGAPLASGATISAAGPHLLEAVVRDLAGNESRASLRFTLDPTAPALVLRGVVDGAQVREAVTLDVELDAAGAAGIVELLVDGVAATAPVRIAGEGRHLVRAALRLDGVVRAAAGLTFTLDETAPALAVSGVQAGDVLAGPVRLLFSATDPFLSFLAATLDDEALGEAAGVLGVDVVDEGEHVLRLTAVDRAGNVAVQAVPFALDRTAPIVTVSTPVEASTNDGPLVPVVDVQDAHPGTLVLTVDGTALSSGEAVDAPGPHVLLAKAVDLAGNVARVSVSFSIRAAPFAVHVTRRGAAAAGDRITLFADGQSTGITSVIDEAGLARFADAPAGRLRARIDHLWQRFFTPEFTLPGPDVFFDVPDEPSYDEVLYVDARASSGGDGSLEAPFGSLPDALAQAGFLTLVKIAGGTYVDDVTVPDGVSVRGGHDPATWAFSPTTRPTLLRGDVRVADGDQVELFDVTLLQAGLSIGRASTLVRDVVLRGTPGTAVAIEAEGADVLVANLLIEGAVGPALTGGRAGTRVENLSAVGNSGGVQLAAEAVLSRSIVVDNAGGGIEGGLGAENASDDDDVRFVAGPLHARYLAQAKGGQSVESFGVDAASVSAEALDLRGRTTAVTSAPDVGPADFGYHAWPVPGDGQPARGAPLDDGGCACRSTSGLSLPTLGLAVLALLRRRRRASSAAPARAASAMAAACVACVFVAVGAMGTGCTFDFARTDGLAPGDVNGRAVRADGGAPAAGARVTVDGVTSSRRAGADGGFLVRGLGTGQWVLRVSDDDDGDGLPERGALRVLTFTPATVGAGLPTLGALLLGDVRMQGVAAVLGDVARDDGLPPSSDTQVVVLRSVDELDAEARGDVDAAALVARELGSDAAGRVVAGAFRLDGVAPGAFRVVAFDPGGEGADAAISAPLSVSAGAGAEIDVGALTLGSADATREVALEVVRGGAADEGAPAVVTLVRAGGERGRASDVLAQVQVELSSTLTLTVPLGLLDVYVDAGPRAPDFHGVLLGQVAFPGDGVLAWGPVALAGVDACAAGGDVDRDDDGVPGLPAHADAPEVHALCLDACSLAGAALTAARCTVGEVEFDCDDDDDGQADVREPACIGACAGTDLDEDGVCDRADLDVVPCSPACTPDDPDDPDDPDNPDDPDDPDPPDPDLPRRGCAAALPLSADGVATGSLVPVRPAPAALGTGVDASGTNDVRDDVDGCFAGPAVDAVLTLQLPGVAATVHATLAGSTFDTTLSAYAGTCGVDGDGDGDSDEEALACNDDGPSGAAAVDLVDVPAGPLLFVVEGFGGAQGEYALHVDGTWAQGAVCDPALTSFTCPGGACASTAEGPRCLGARDCADGDGAAIDADDDGSVDEDAAACLAPPVLSCPRSVVRPVLSRVEVAAAAAGDVARRRWSLLEAPLGADLALEGAATDTTSFTPLLAGRYRLRHVVEDPEGQLVACDVDLIAATDDVFRVELLWNIDVAAGDPSDLDLHLLHPDAPAWFDSAFDCHFDNCRAGALSWARPGDTGPDPSASLDLDDRDGRGPENINVRAPEDVSYRIGAHYFADDGAGPADVLVNVFCFGQLAATLGPVSLATAPDDPEGNDFWKVADVAFANGACTVQPLDEVVSTREARTER